MGGDAPRRDGGMMVDILDEELLRNMKLSGCHTILFGIESFEQEALDSTKKGITVG